MLSSIARLLPDLQDPLCLLEAVRGLPSFMISNYLIYINVHPLTTESGVQQSVLLNGIKSNLLNSESCIIT